MKKTLTINLNKQVFNIDEDAYELLNSYLEEVANHFSTGDEKNDIMFDIETRIAELFTEKLDKTENVVTVQEVDDIIQIMGKPEQYIEEDDETEEKTSRNTTKTASTSTKRKLYRNVDNQILGGVLSGLSEYLDWDAVWVRLIFTLLTIFTSGTFVLIYFVLWLVVPKAITVSQKMEMKGEKVNIDTLNKKKESEIDQLNAYYAGKGSGLGSFVRAVFKVIAFIVLAFAGMIGGIVLIVLLILAIAAILAAIGLLFGIGTPMVLFPESISTAQLVTVIISSILVIGTPVFSLIYWLTGRKEKEERSHSPYWISLVLFLAGVFMLVGSGKRMVRDIEFNDNSFAWNKQITGDEITQQRDIADFYGIDVSNAIVVELTQSNDEKVEVITLPDVIDKIETKVENGILRIYTNEDLRSLVKVKVNVDSLTAINASGASIVDFENRFLSKNMKIDVSGASRLDGDFSSIQRLDVHSSGASRLELAGIADTLHIEASGASRIEADDLEAQTGTVNASGVSKVEISVKKLLTTIATGASKIE